MGSRGERACGARLHRSQRASGAKARTLVFAHNEAGSCQRVLLRRVTFFFKINLFILFIYFWLRWVFLAAIGLSLVAASRDYSSLRCAGFSLWWLLLLRSTGSRCAGFSSCGMQAQQLWLAGSRAQPQQLWRTGLVAAQHVGSSRTRA